MPDDHHRSDRETAESKLVHDLRHSLYALKTGIDLLPQLSADPRRFDEIHALLQREVSRASELAKRVVDERGAASV
ncbi:MAG: hypothetical protein KF861_23835 [Planctomycetaceae bacterium]|nr:hypothetical protein [Planctomycetaceae bacterium]